jgi:hypothetical protein
VYQTVKGIEVQLVSKGSVGDLANAVEIARAPTPGVRYYEWVGYCYQLFMLAGILHVEP